MSDENPQPRILVALLAKQKGLVLDFFLETLLNWDYPKERIHLYVRTNNNTDDTEAILKRWLNLNGHLYSGVTFNSENVSANVEQYGVHEWNAARFSVLAKIRQESMLETLKENCQYYFVTDLDNFLLPHTLSTLVSRQLPIVAPLLRYALSSVQFPDPQGSPDADAYHYVYSNYHNIVDPNGYYFENQNYYRILEREIIGMIKVPLIHCTYLIDAKFISKLYYSDNSERHEYVIFAHSARNAGIDQYLDNSEVFGCLTLVENAPASRNYLENLQARN